MENPENSENLTFTITHWRDQQNYFHLICFPFPIPIIFTANVPLPQNLTIKEASSVMLLAKIIAIWHHFIITKNGVYNQNDLNKNVNLKKMISS